MTLFGVLAELLKRENEDNNNWDISKRNLWFHTKLIIEDHAASFKEDANYF